MSELFGWDLMYKVTEKDLKKKEDVITLFIHYLLIKAGYKCIGIGEDVSFNRVIVELIILWYITLFFFSFRKL